MTEKSLETSDTDKNSNDAGKHIETKVAKWMENFSLVALILVITYFISIIPDIVSMYHLQHSKNIKLNLYEYFLVIPSFIFSFSLYKFCTKYLIHKWEPYVSKVIVRQQETPEKRLHRLGDYMYKGIYDSCSWLMVMYLTYGSVYAPSEFGGSFEASKAIAMWPYEVSLPIRLFYMVHLGHHLERLTYELWNNYRSNSFYTMSFHHLVTVMLIFLSFYCRHVMFGITVILTHDINDVFLNYCRFLRESVYEKGASFFFMITLISWIYTRMYIFARRVIFGILSVLVNLPSDIRKYVFLHYFFCFGLITLFILNIFWTFQLLRVFVWRFVKKDKNLPFEDFKSKNKTKKLN